MWAAVFFASVTVVSAHDTGHGKTIAGLGPHGGALAPVISAKEAELGDKAKTLAIAEWKREGGKLELHLLDLKKKPHNAKLAGEVKWILLKEKGAKPEILVTKHLSNEFPSLEGVKSVEVILPAGMLSSEKAVAAFSLK
jgi:hypothetical protein